MISRERVYAALDFARPDRVPRDVWGQRAVAVLRPDEWAELIGRFPMDFSRAPSVLGPSRRARQEPGLRVDDWGSAWTALQAGLSGEVTDPALGDWFDLEAFTPPWEMITSNAVAEVNAFCRSSDAFRLGEIGPGPFERMQFLRGTENLFVDLVERSGQLATLLRVVHEFYLEHVRLWTETDVDAITMGDDWGSQTALLVSPSLWREVFRPLYADYWELAHSAGKRVFFHSDGMIREIIPDLIEIGVDALNAQIFCMDIEELAATFGGRVTFWGEIDRQRVLPFGTTDEVRQAVRRVRAAFGDSAGGVIAQVSWGVEDPLENILAAYEEWDGE